MRVIHRRLEFRIEEMRIVSPIPFGSRRGRSALNCVGILVTDIQDVFGRCKTLLAFSLDIKGAFNWIRADILLKDMIELGLSDSVSLLFGVGVLQLSVLSLILYNIYMAKINSLLPLFMRLIMYANDLLIYCEEDSIDEALRAMKEVLNILNPWLHEIGFRIALDKSPLTLCSRKRIKTEEMSMEFGGRTFERQSVLRYLGVVLDQRITWRAHIDVISTEESRATNLLRP